MNINHKFKMMNKLIVLLAMMMTALVCCTPEPPVQEDIQIRIENISGFDYKNIKVISFNDKVVYNDLDSSTSSEYKVFERAYEYAYIEIIIDGETYILQPIDFTGEEELEPGKYTYQIDANNSLEQYDKLSLIFRKD